MTHPTVSAILPNYNYAKFFRSRLIEVLTQTYPISELIVLDDASTDNSIELINAELKKLKLSHPDLKIIFKPNAKNSGSVFSQWQKGIKLASSDYLWITELDDSCAPTFLEAAMAPIEIDPKIVLSYTNSKLIGSVSTKDSLRQVKDFARRRHLPGTYIVDGIDELNKNLAVYNSIPNVSACIIKNIPE